MLKSCKKLLFIFISCFSLLATGCMGDAIVDDGTNIFDFTKNPDGTGGNGGSGVAWPLCKNGSYDIFDIQVWGDGAGTFDYENKSDCGRFTVITVGGGWVGGGLIASDTSKTFDFTGVSKMKFDIRGNINPKALCIAVQNNGGATATMYPSKTALTTSAKIDSLSETEWKSVEFDVSKAASDTIINAFCIIAAGDWGGSFKANDYWEIRNLDWVDASGNSVTLKLK